MTPIDQLRMAAEGNPAAMVSFEGIALSYAQLYERSLRCAQGLRECGIGEGDRVGLWLPNSHAYLDLLYACMHIGAIAVSVNTRLRQVEVVSILRRTGATALALAPGFKHVPGAQVMERFDADEQGALRTVILCGDGAAEPPPTKRLQTVRHRELLARAPGRSVSNAALRAAIFPTSGTTNLPKFALHTQGAIARHAAQVAPAFGYDRSARLLQAIPFCGIFGYSQMMAAVAGQASVTITSLFEPLEAGRIIRAEGITHLNGPDDLVKRLLDAFPEDVPFPSIRECLIASFNPTLAAFPAEAERRGIRMTNGFGMSEIYSFFSRPPPDAPLSVRQLPGGVPVNPTARVRTRDEQTGAILAYGETGSLEVASDTLFCEYFGDPVATAAAFTPDGYFITGDLGSVEADGSFRFKGRKGDFLRLGGFLVSPAEIETPLQQFAGVETVVAVEATTARGNKCVAFVRMRPGHAMDPQQMTSSARQVLADFKVPIMFVEVSEFPVAMGPNGEKIQRAKLKEMALRALEGATH